MQSKTIALTVALFVALPAMAHHSFDGFFDATKPVKLTGTVTEFRFTEPHGMIVLTVKGSDGLAQQWQVETTSAAGMLRAGWTEHSLTTGETIHVDGWAARSGKSMIRLHAARHPDGSLIGTAFEIGPGRPTLS